MGHLSQFLRTSLESTALNSEGLVTVAIRLNQLPTATISSVPATAAARNDALEVLSTVGLHGDILRSTTLQPKQIVAGVPTVIVQVRVGELEQLAASSGVEYVRPVRIHRMHLNTSIKLLSLVTGSSSERATSYDGSGVRVAVIDSGIDHNHPDLQGRINLELSRNFTDEGSETDVTDRLGHGTHVAGIIGGAGLTYRGIAPGVEIFACKVFNSIGSLTSEGSLIAAVRWAVEQGAHVINYSGGYVPIINNPILGRMPMVPPPWVWPTELLEEEVEFKRAMDNGIVTVASAGNEGSFGRRGTLSVPATCPAVISVGAVDKNLVLSSFSSGGPAYRSARVTLADFVKSLTTELEPHTHEFLEVDLVAPGGEVDRSAALSGGCSQLPGIISTLSSQAGEIQSTRQNCIVDSLYLRLSGTSQAAPHISGLAALILEAVRKMNLDLGPHKAFIIKNILLAAAQPLDGHSPEEQGRGIPNWSSIEKILKDIKDGHINISSFEGE